MLSRALASLLSTAALTLVLCTDLTSAQTVRWASSGGGWRSMSVNMGYAHAFSRVGMLDGTTGATVPQISAVSSNSGGSWFTIQFFYSQAFFNKVLESSDSVYALAKQWMESYVQYIEDLPDQVICSIPTFFGLFGMLEDFRLLCNTYVGVDFDYAAFVDGMARFASTVYGDPTLMDRVMNSGNKVSRLANTDLLIQTSLSPTAKVEDSKDLVLVGPNQSEEKYAVFTALQYSVKSNNTFYFYGLPEEDLPLQVKTVKAPWVVTFDSWEAFNLYPGTEGSVFANRENDRKGTLGTDTGSGLTHLADFFGGAEPQVKQIMAASSATNARFSGLTPTFLTQWLSVSRNSKAEGNIFDQVFGVPAVNAQLNLFYSLPQSAEFSICSQWPEDCGASDGRFADGGNSDGPSLALNIGNYHTVDNGDLTQTLKVIVTNNNYYLDTNVKFLSYFSTTFNQDVRPGDFVWPPQTVPGDAAQENPWRSMQIFGDYLDDESMLAAFNPIPNTNLTTAIYQVTTIDNPTYKVKAGQQVDILLLQINSNIPTTLLQRGGIQTWTLPLAELAQQIASNDELVARIESFLAM